MAEDRFDDRSLDKLVDAGRTLVSDLDLEILLRRLLETARQLTGARYAAIGILNRARTGLERFITLGVDDATHAAIGDLPQGRGVLGLLISDPEPIRLSDVSEHPRSFGYPPNHPPMKSFLGVPIVVRGEAYGNLYLTEKDGGGPFEARDERATVVLAEWAAIAIHNARLHAADRRRDVIAAAELERGRWARELHDETLQDLAALRVRLSSALHSGRPDLLQTAAAETVDGIAEEIESLRSLMTELRPPALDELGLAAALEGLIERFRTSQGISVQVEISLAAGPDPDSQLSEEAASAIYRLIQEGLNNVAKHADAEKVRLRVVEEGGQVAVTLIDDGAGFDEATPTAGFGILGMRERATLLNGSLELRSIPGYGTRLHAVIPVPSSVGAGAVAPT